MNIKLELLKNHISELVCQKIECFEIDADRIVDTTATNILAEIQSVVKNEEYDDFTAMEEIVCIFEKYKIDFGFRHNY